MKITVSIDVSDLKKAEDFYVGSLGCKKIRDQGSKMVVLSTDNCDIYLQIKENGTKLLSNSDIIRNYNRHWTPVHLDFLTKDVEGTLKNIIELGGLHEGGESGDWGTIAYCADPFGNGFCLINE